MIKYEEGRFLLLDHNSKFGTLMLVERPYKILPEKIAIQVGRTVVTFALKPKMLENYSSIIPGSGYSLENESGISTNPSAPKGKKVIQNFPSPPDTQFVRNRKGSPGITHKDAEEKRMREKEFIALATMPIGMRYGIAYEEMGQDLEYQQDEQRMFPILNTPPPPLPPAPPKALIASRPQISSKQGQRPPQMKVGVRGIVNTNAMPAPMQGSNAFQMNTQAMTSSMVFRTTSRNTTTTSNNKFDGIRSLNKQQR